MGLLDRLRNGLTRTTQLIVRRFDEIARRADSRGTDGSAADSDTIEALEELLISADVGTSATHRILAVVRERAGHGVSLRELVKAEIRAMLDRAETTASEAPATSATGHGGTPRVTPVKVVPVLPV